MRLAVQRRMRSLIAVSRLPDPECPLFRRYRRESRRDAGTASAGEMALHVLAYNLTRVMNTIGIQPLITAMRA
jgi:hypothetical protein